MTTMTARTMTMETKAMVVMVASGERQWQEWKRGSTAGTVASLVAAVAVWEERGVGGGGSAAAT